MTCGKPKELKAAKVEFIEECGGGGSMITFKIPAEARMFLIPPLYIKYCQNQGIDPSDRVACDHYREVIDGSEEMLAALHVCRDLVGWSHADGPIRLNGIPEVFNLQK